jgi:hypothetical protein
MKYGRNNVLRKSVVLLLSLLAVCMMAGVWLWSVPVAYASDYDGDDGGETPEEVTGISMDQESAELMVGDTLLLTVTVAPEDAVCPELAWTSSDEAVATVDEEGLVTAISKGAATVSFTAGTFTGSCEITVIPAVALALDHSELTLAQNDTQKLNVTVTSDSEDPVGLVWASSASDIVAVDNSGSLTAQAVGTATITVSAGGASDACAVTVVPSQILAPGYTIDRDGGHLKGVKVETSVDELVSNLDNDADQIMICNKDGAPCTSEQVYTGMMVKLVVNGDVKDQLTIKAIGDLNGDGSMGMYEYTKARVQMLGAGGVSNEDAELLDINGDKRISITDYTIIRLEILGLNPGWDSLGNFPDLQPTLTGLSPAGCSVKVTWGAVADAAGYEIYRAGSESGAYQQIASVGRGVLTYTDTNVNDGSTCYYKVLAYKMVGPAKITTQNSAVKSVKIPALTVYYQGDPRWGFSSSVRKSACLLTAYAITINNMGIPCTPPNIYKSNGNRTPMNMTNLRNNFSVKPVCALPAGSKYLSSFDGHKTYMKNPSANAKAAIKEALKLHPEGVILYFKKGGDAHAIVACKILGDEIYFSDPGRNRTTLVNFANTWCVVGHNMSYKHLVEMIALDRV